MGEIQQIDRDYAGRIVLDSGSWKAGNAIIEGKDDGHYIVQYMREFREAVERPQPIYDDGVATP